MGLCVKLNRIVTLTVVLLAGVWFMLVVLLPQSVQLRSRTQRAGEVWRGESISHPLGVGNDDAVELVEIINHDVPNIFRGVGIILVTSEWSDVDYSYLLYSLSTLKLLGERYRFPVYILLQKSNHNLYNQRSVMQQARTLQLLISRCMEQHNLKELTIIAYQQGALLTLMALAITDSSFIFRIDKLILLNPFNPKRNLYQNNVRSLSRAIQRHITADANRLVAFHYLRILIVNTFRTVHQQDPQSRNLFNFVFTDSTGSSFQLNSTLTISTKAISEVNSYLEYSSYLTHRPLVNLLMRVIIDDQKSKLTIEGMEYVLRYREDNEEGERPSGKCGVLFLEELEKGSVEVKSNCYRIVQRQRHRLNQAVLLLYSTEKIQLYGEDMGRVPASIYHSSKYYTSVITNLKNVNEMLLIAGEKSVHLQLTIVRSPLRNPFWVGNEQEVRVINQQETVLIESCQGWRPIIGLTHNQNFKELVEWRQGDCYIELQDYNSYSEWFSFNWTVVRNIIIFSMFTSHVLGAYSNNRYYTTLFLNLMLLLFLLRKLYLFESMVITSTATLFQLIAAAFLKASQWLHLSSQYYLVVLFIPLAIQLLGRLGMGGLASNPSASLRFLWIQLLLVNHDRGYLIALIKFYFMLDIYNTQQLKLSSLALMIIWQAGYMPQSPLRVSTALSRAKTKLVDILFLLMLCFSLEQEGSVIHQLINFYMITHLLMSAGEYVNRLMENH